MGRIRVISGAAIPIGNPLRGYPAAVKTGRNVARNLDLGDWSAGQVAGIENIQALALGRGVELK